MPRCEHLPVGVGPVSRPPRIAGAAPAAAAALIVLATLWAPAPPAAAQDLRAEQALMQPPRSFTAATLRGELQVLQPPEVLLNGRPARLAPGARIRGQDNLLLMSGAMQGQRLVVHYTRDTQGNLMEVWVLRPSELARRPWPATPQQAAAWRFDPASQTWSR
jgi:hypothetical protein